MHEKYQSMRRAAMNFYSEKASVPVLFESTRHAALASIENGEQ